MKASEQTMRELEESRQRIILEMPNIPRPDVPVGGGERDNKTIRKVGTPRKFDFPAKDYLELSAAHELLDLERAAKVSGARFVYFKNDGALLSMALVRYGLDIAIKEGFRPILPPVLIGEPAMRGMGYLEAGGDEEVYQFTKDGLYLVGTSEQAVGPLHMDEVLDASSLPIRYVAFSTCFRREAGSYGKDTKGIIRVHQFDKVEMFSITTPEQSDKEHEYLLSLQEKFVQGLELPYRVLSLCTGDLGAPSARTYDIETWIPSQDTYRETHSSSTTTDFQSRRLRIRVKDNNGERQFAHMLNGTMVAVNRPWIAIVENFQQADGSIAIPKVLQPYLFGRTQIG
jgi:seryl-tRNA synthetase